MKLASYVAQGKAAFGAVIGEGVIDLSERLGGRYAGLRHALAGNALAEMKKAAEGAKPDHRLADVRFLPPIPDPERSSVPASTTARMRSRPAAICPSSPACFFDSPARSPATTVSSSGHWCRAASISRASWPW